MQRPSDQSSSCSIAIPTPQLGGFKVQDGSWGPCTVCSQHCNPRWRLGAVCREAIHNTSIQEGGWGPCTEFAHGPAIQDGGWGACTEFAHGPAIQGGGWGPCTESAQGTAIQDGSWGPCTERLLRALTSGALSNTTTLDRGELCPLPSLPFPTEETHIKQLHPPACKGSMCTLKQNSHLSIFDQKLNFPLLRNQTWPHFVSSRDTREDKPCWE